MMRIKTKIGDSPIHNQGLFAVHPIPSGTVVWSFSPLFDRPISEHVYSHAPPKEREKLFDRGFQNPHAPNVAVLCGDEGQFMNFPRIGEEPNIIVSGAIDGYDVLAAARDIEVGEELTVAPESDYNYPHKVHRDDVAS
jgi:SET domain-containing protein